MRVAVLGGGRSSEHEVSLASAAAVREGLAEGGHEPLAVLIGRDGRFSFEGAPLALEPGGGLLGADVAFPVLHGPFGEDGTVQGLLEVLDLPYVGAGVAASALAMDKVLFKEVMAQAGLPQVDYVALREGEDRSPAATLGFPVFVKPARLGSSVGIAKVASEDELAPALDSAFAHDSLVIVEAFSSGLEIECSVLGNGCPEASEPGEITIEAEWYDYEAKYRPGGMELVIPARVSAEDRERVRDLAVRSFTHIGCAGLARADFFVEPGGRVLLNELNTLPGFTQTSVYARLFEASGVPYAELLGRLLDLAVERFEAERSLEH
ncbi:MAG TPA: D-alanine--D-alanine ligase family protein [Thermoleophilaceae bacterium]|nr:D-alanine--D-alanine ligase family protein [Thermoleophilaceae bacterium]